jgi:hypothetical protein
VGTQGPLSSPSPLGVIAESSGLVRGLCGTDKKLGFLREIKPGCSAITPGAYTEKRRADFSKFLFVLIQIDIKMIKKRNLKTFGVLKDTIKGTSSPKNVQAISFEGIRLKGFEGIWSFFLLKSTESLSSVQEPEGVSVVVKCALAKGLLPSAQLTLALKTWKDAELS